MKELEKEIRKNGFDYHLVASSEFGFVYAQISNANLVGYEVFKRKEGKEYTLQGTVIPASVQFPGNEAFGTWAWSYKSLEKAKAKLIELKERALTPAAALYAKYPDLAAEEGTEPCQEEPKRKADWTAL